MPISINSQGILGKCSVCSGESQVSIDWSNDTIRKGLAEKLHAELRSEDDAAYDKALNNYLEEGGMLCLCTQHAEGVFGALALFLGYNVKKRKV